MVCRKISLIVMGDVALMDWRKVLAYITCTVDEELLLRNEYLPAENRILMGQLKERLRLTDPQRKTVSGPLTPSLTSAARL